MSLHKFYEARLTIRERKMKKTNKNGKGAGVCSVFTALNIKAIVSNNLLLISRENFL